MDSKTKLELLIAARDGSKAAFEQLAKSFEKAQSGASVTTAQLGKMAKLKEPLMQLASGPMQGLIRSFGAFINLAKLLPAAVLGPIGILIGILVALEAKFHVIAKVVGTVKEVFSSLVSLDFEGLGQRISDVWTGAKEKAEAAKKSMQEYFELTASLSDARGNSAAAAFDREVVRHKNAIDTIEAAEKERHEKLTGQRTLEEALHKQLLSNIAKAEKESSAKRLSEMSAEDKKRNEEKIKSTQKMLDETEAVMAAEAEAASKKADGALKVKEMEEKIALDKRVEAARENDRKLAEIDQEKFDRFLQQYNDFNAQLAQIDANRLALFQSIVGSFQSAFGGLLDTMINTSVKGTDAIKAAFTAWGRSILQMIGQIIAKFIFLNVLKMIFAGATGGIGGLISGFAAKGLANMSFQTHYGQTRQIPGPFNAPVPIMAHGGEIIGRPSGVSSGNSVTIMGDVFGWDEAMERIRGGLYKHQKMTGLAAAF